MKLRTLMLIVAGISLGFGVCVEVYRQVVGPVIPDALLDQLQLGMSMPDVEAVLGEPTVRREGDMTYPTSETWIYQRALNVGWVEVFFDHDGRLSSVNDESAIPRHWRQPNSPRLP